MLWYADPAGADERSELVCAGFKIRRGINAMRTGLAAVTARVESGRLRIEQGRCVHLLEEAQLYRYDDGPECQTEAPLNEHNHALDALRYLISSLDAGTLAGRRSRPTPTPDAPDASEAVPPRAKACLWFPMDDKDHWIEL